MKKVLLIGDIVGHEKIGLSAMLPILSNMECNVNNLLTSIVSNTFDYGISEMQDLTGYMSRTLEIWKKLNFKFDIIFIGLITSMDQVKIINELIEFNDNPLVINDPIMGDDGSLYHGLSDKVTEYTKAMVNSSNIIIPNLTEASIILDEDFPENITDEVVMDWLDRLSHNNKSVLITSVKLNNKYYVYGIDNYNHKGKIFRVEYDLIPYKFAGTGDIFSALVTGKLANGEDLQSAVSYACDKISWILKSEKSNQGQVKSVEIEKYLKYI